MAAEVLGFSAYTINSAVCGASLNQTQTIHTNQAGWGNYQIGGGIAGTNALYIDGAPITNLRDNNIGLIPTQDSIQEFNVSTNSSSAEFGRTGGGVVNMASKGGSNSFHGSAYEYFRNTVLDANKWESNLNGLDRWPLQQNQFGANLGGLIKKDKLFFFFSWEGFKSAQGSPITSWMPTEANRAGYYYSNNPVDATKAGKAANCEQHLATDYIDSYGQHYNYYTPPTCTDSLATWFLNNYWAKPNMAPASQHGCRS